MFRATEFFENLISAPEESKSRKILLLPLDLLSFFYGIILAVRRLLYRFRVFHAASLNCRVVSVGNITLGGTGKTPLVCLLAEMVQAAGYRVAVVSRGYKGNYHPPFALVSDGQRVLMNAAEAGDEPYLLARKLPGVPVVVGRERARAGRFAEEKFHSHVILLDDGFQHLALKRDLNLLLVDAQAQFGNRRLFPRGLLREPFTQLSRADAFVLTKVGQSSSINNLMEDVRKAGGHRPVFLVTYAPDVVRTVEGTLPVASLAGRKVLAFCGIARPESFRDMLSALQAEIAGWETFPDHYAYTAPDRDRLFAEAKRLRVDALVTTEKDMTRWELIDPVPGPAPLWALSIRHVFRREEDGGRFEEFLFSRLGLR